MLNKIQGYFAPQGDDNISLEHSDEHIRLAVATVLLSAARADAHFAESEKALLLTQLQNRLGISAEEARTLESQAEIAETKHLLKQYAEMLANELSLAQREFILTLAWSIITADSVVAAQESAFAAQLRHMLGLSLEQSLRARKASEGTNQDGFKEIVEASKDVHDSIAKQLSNLFGRNKRP